MQQGPNIYQIKFAPDLPEDVLIAADVDGMEQRICGEDIYPYWEYIYENEGGFVETDGRYILCVLHTAGMQGGVVMFWDTAEEELVHVSDVPRSVLRFGHDRHRGCDDRAAPRSRSAAPLRCREMELLR